jgi:tRNA U34 5-carboxymethylaminomethyl modifying enzyme MnmG/GidA
VTDSEKDKDSQLKMAWLYYNNFDFSKIEKKARTKAASSLRANLERASGVSTKKLKSKTRTRATGDDIDFSLFEKALGNK